MLGWMNHKMESRLLGERSATSDMQIDTTLMAECKKELKSLLMKVKEESEKAGEFQKNIYFCFTDDANIFDYMDHNKLWKILQKMGISDHITCLLRNLYTEQEATVQLDMGK